MDNASVTHIPSHNAEHNVHRDIENLTHLWIMYYRHGMNPGLSKGFYCAGNFEEAKRRAWKHCEIMGYKFTFIRPMVHDLDADEEYRLKGGGGEFTP